jgi:hypothetical protein
MGEPRTIARSEESRKKGISSRPPRTTPRKWKDRPDSNDRAATANDTDVHSKASDSGTSARTTPSSVLINGHPLIRDLSDLSGSYLNGNTRGATRPGTIPRNVYQSDQSATSYQRPWRQARLLSSRAPLHPQPPTDCGDSFTALDRKASSVLFMSDGVIEVVKAAEALEGRHCRAPLVLVLMDPGRKIYELMQLWVDVSSDTVRDVMHAIQLSLGDHWRQDYDGIFQVRNNHFSQLIHVLNISKYDVKPHEVWVCKPWSMAAKNTVAYASEVLNHLKYIGVLCSKTAAATKPITTSHKQKSEESVLLLSPDAQSRLYVPEGVLKHHHAFQFLTFSPPFETLVRVDVLAADTDDGSASQLSDSHYSLPMASSEDKLGGSMDDNADERVLVISSQEIAKSLSGLLTTTTAPTQNDRSIESPSQMQRSTTSQHFPHRQGTDNYTVRSEYEDRLDEVRAVGGFSRLFSALNCGRSKSHRSPNNKDADQMGDTSETLMESPMGGLLWQVWEEESRAEDQSVVSDSAPLLIARQSSDGGRRYLGFI